MFFSFCAAIRAATTGTAKVPAALCGACSVEGVRWLQGAVHLRICWARVPSQQTERRTKADDVEGSCPGVDSGWTSTCETGNRRGVRCAPHTLPRDANSAALHCITHHGEPSNAGIQSSGEGRTILSAKVSDQRAPVFGFQAHGQATRLLFGAPLLSPMYSPMSISSAAKCWFSGR